MSQAPTSNGIDLAGMRAAISGSVIGPDEAGYDEARATFSASDLHPAAIVRVGNVDDVAFVVKLAASTGLELAVRSGGHSGASHGSTEGGIQLDLRAMQRLEVDVDARTAWAETGLTAGEVTTAVGKHGLAIGFGDTGSVGIGGITTGGGIGFLVRKHGLTIDNVLAADIVTATGELVRTDATQHPDLFWAIRGGGGNFGVVTRFQYRLHALPGIVGGMLFLPATADTIAGFMAAAEAAPDELSTIANVMPCPPMPFVPTEHHGKLVIMGELAYAGEAETGQRALAPFRELAPPLADLTGPMSYGELFMPDDPDYRPIAATRILFLDRVDREVAEVIVKEIEEHMRTSGAQMAVAQLRVLGGAMARVPVEATAFAHRSSRIMAAVAALVTTPEELPAHVTWAERVAAELRQGDQGAYVNFLGDEGPARIRAAYPGPTWDRLVAIKDRYDPTNVFRRNQNVGPSKGASA